MPEQIQNQKTAPLSGSTLKLIAVFSMLLDHVGAVLTASYLPWLTLRLIGRVAFPIFCFLLVEGFVHTNNLKRYGLRLAAFALLSELPFDLAFHHAPFYPNAQNVFFTLLIGLFTIALIRYEETACKTRPFAFFCIAATLAAGMALAHLLRTDYGAYGVLVIFLFYWQRGHRQLACISACVCLCFLSDLEITAFAAIPLIGLYNGRRGLHFKYFFYACYPVHLLLLWLLSLL